MGFPASFAAHICLLLMRAMAKGEYRIKGCPQ